MLTSQSDLFMIKEAIQYKTYNGMQFHRNQPEYSLANKLKFGVKISFYNSPALLKSLRKVQQLMGKLDA